MRLTIKLIGSGGKFDHQTIDVPDLPRDRSTEIHVALKCWTLSPGDTIKIEEID